MDKYAPIIKSIEFIEEAMLEERISKKRVDEIFSNAQKKLLDWLEDQKLREVMNTSNS